MPDSNIIQIDQNLFETRLDRLITEKMTQILNAMLDAEADEITGAARYERSGGRKAYRAGHYERKLTAKAGRLELKVPKLKGTLFESAVIERGLKGVRLVVGDRCAGLVATVGSMLPKAKYQRCMVHFMRNVLSKTPPTHREWASAATWTCPSSMTTSWKRTDHRAMDGHDPKCATFRTLPALTSYHVDMNEDIKLNDLLHLTDEEISRTKIRFMTNYNGTEPIKVFREDPDELNTDWLLSRKRNDNGKDAEHLHKGENVIGLVRLPENNDLWVLTCLKRIGDPLECPKEKSEDDDPHYVGYEGEELTEYRKFYGRVIVRYHKDAQQPIQYAEGLLDNLIVEKVLSSAEPL